MPKTPTVLLPPRSRASRNKARPAKRRIHLRERRQLFRRGAFYDLLNQRQHRPAVPGAAPETQAPQLKLRLREQEWLANHQEEYRGHWVALEAGMLVSHGKRARDVLADAKARGFEQPLLVRIPDTPDLPFGGW